MNDYFPKLRFIDNRRFIRQNSFRIEIVFPEDISKLISTVYKPHFQNNKSHTIRSRIPSQKMETIFHLQSEKHTHIYTSLLLC